MNAINYIFLPQNKANQPFRLSGSMM